MYKKTLFVLWKDVSEKSSTFFSVVNGLYIQIYPPFFSLIFLLLFLVKLHLMMKIYEKEQDKE